jgi:hypothetical protein
MTTYTRQILIAADAEALSYHPIVGRLTGVPEGFKWEGNDVYNPHVPEWVVIGVEADTIDRLDYLVNYQAGRLDSGMRAYCIGDTVWEDETS